MKFYRMPYISLLSNFLYFIEKLTFYKKLSIYLKEIESPINIFDVGANKGQSYRFFRKKFPQAYIYSFEPNKYAFNFLNKIKDDNLFKYNIAFGSECSEKIFYESILSEISTFILPNYQHRRFKLIKFILRRKPEEIFTERKIKTSTIDSFMHDNKINCINLLKIDTEGFELEILQGSIITLKSKLIKLVLVEVHKNNHRIDNIVNIQNLLTSNNFSQVAEFNHCFGDHVDILFKLN